MTYKNLVTLTLSICLAILSSNLAYSQQNLPNCSKSPNSDCKVQYQVTNYDDSGNQLTVDFEFFVDKPQSSSSGSGSGSSGGPPPTFTPRPDCSFGDPSCWDPESGDSQNQEYQTCHELNGLTNQFDNLSSRIPQHIDCNNTGGIRNVLAAERNQNFPTIDNISLILNEIVPALRCQDDAMSSRIKQRLESILQKLQSIDMNSLIQSIVQCADNILDDYTVNDFNCPHKENLPQEELESLRTQINAETNSYATNRATLYHWQHTLNTSNHQAIVEVRSKIGSEINKIDQNSYKIRECIKQIEASLLDIRCKQKTKQIQDKLDSEAYSILSYSIGDCNCDGRNDQTPITQLRNVIRDIQNDRNSIAECSDELKQPILNELDKLLQEYEPKLSSWQNHNQKCALVCNLNRLCTEVALRMPQFMQPIADGDANLLERYKLFQEIDPQVQKIVQHLMALKNQMSYEEAEELNLKHESCSMNLIHYISGKNRIVDRLDTMRPFKLLESKQGDINDLRMAFDEELKYIDPMWKVIKVPFMGSQDWRFRASELWNDYPKIDHIMGIKIPLGIGDMGIFKSDNNMYQIDGTWTVPTNEPPTISLEDFSTNYQFRYPCIRLRGLRVADVSENTKIVNIVEDRQNRIIDCTDKIKLMEDY